MKWYLYYIDYILMEPGFIKKHSMHKSLTHSIKCPFGEYPFSETPFGETLGGRYNN